MTPWQLAQQWWTQHNSTDFAKVTAAHIAHGYIWSSPDCLLLAHDLHWDGAEARTDVEPNAYFVTMAMGGTLGRLMRLLPERREWLAWIRNGGSELKVYPWDKIEKKVRN